MDIKSKKGQDTATSPKTEKTASPARKIQQTATSPGTDSDNAKDKYDKEKSSKRKPSTSPKPASPKTPEKTRDTLGPSSLVKNKKKRTESSQLTPPPGEPTTNIKIETEPVRWDPSKFATIYHTNIPLIEKPENVLIIYRKRFDIKSILKNDNPKIDFIDKQKRSKHRKKHYNRHAFFESIVGSEYLEKPESYVTYAKSLILSDPSEHIWTGLQHQVDLAPNGTPIHKYNLVKFDALNQVVVTFDLKSKSLATFTPLDQIKDKAASRSSQDAQVSVQQQRMRSYFNQPLACISEWAQNNFYYLDAGGIRHEDP